MGTFYQGSFSIDLEDLGDTWYLEGVVLGNGHDSLIMGTPEANEQLGSFDWWKPSVAEMEAWLKQSDDPIMQLAHEENGKLVKTIVRKATRQLDQQVVWACYARDAYTCVYCGTSGVPLTYDHYLAQKYGGQTTMENGRTSCRPCNKRKGHMTIEEWKSYAETKGLNDGEQIHTP